MNDRLTILQLTDAAGSRAASAPGRAGSAEASAAVASAPGSASAGVDAATDAVARYALGLGDDALVLAQRLGEWIANAPELEEDVALGNIGLDLLGHARALLTYAGSAWGRTEDDLAYFREEAQFQSRWLFELPNGPDGGRDFAFTILRQLIASLYFGALYRRLASSSDETLAAIAAKAVKEVAYHAEHATLWTLRLGLGTDESHRRMTRALADLWPFMGELFAPDPAVRALVAAGIDTVAVAPESLCDEVLAVVGSVLEDSGLAVPEVPFLQGGGRLGRHSEQFGRLVGEMQLLARAHPGATW
ncbi:1,2-phenylacetyl-CoA epoxidase subunit PaaC [Microbacterium allomyrinae]|uniref:Phenylacetate-CoA oxygenase subunit PaaC n=1 Tax=Microbacterium allomyrinae TaxID=2830666 RepID=A0A9X1S4A0_9MICO|nr:1,2-phenylacetyl-CoA epoxidase subunit PaaC [Microbacterium allomyrinae]MCC2033312.1 phenylacetate-CoA oxygenase subunit PaaC [Microbacterium allomyrinae]